MSIIKKRTSAAFFRNMCIVMIWFITIYSSIVQYVLFEIPYGMLGLGAAVLFCYVKANSENPFVIRDAITEEDIRMVYFMAYIFVAGILFAPDRNSHFNQWITCLEYLFIEIVIASIIKNSGTDAFHLMLMIESVLIAVVFLRNPIEYEASGRYSISEKINPNALGLGFVAGIWAVLYKQTNKKQSLVVTVGLVTLLGYSILLTGSRKALIGAGLTIILWLFICFLPGLKAKGTSNGMISFLIMFVLALIILYEFSNIYGNTTIATRMDNLFYEVSEGKRSNMYHEGYELFITNPLFGIGFQGFKYHFGMYSHATLVEIPVSGGIIGALLYFSAYMLSIRKIIHLYKETRVKAELYIEHNRIKMILILWMVMGFFTICIIHPYQFDSGIYLGIIFGETAYIENTIRSQQKVIEKKKIGRKYIKA